MKISDPIGGEISLQLARDDDRDSLHLSVPYSGSIDTLVMGYSVAETLTTRFSASFKDLQLADRPNLFLAKQEWKRRHGPYILELAFNGKIPSDLTLKIDQGKLLNKVEYEITGTDVTVKWKSQLKSGKYRIPILSLGEPQERTVRSGQWYTLLVPGLMFLFIATTQTDFAQGIFAIVGFGFFFVAPVLYFLAKFRIIVVPGRGGSMFLSLSKRSRPESLQFLDSIERVKAALIRFGASRLQYQGESSSIV